MIHFLYIRIFYLVIIFVLKRENITWRCLLSFFMYIYFFIYIYYICLAVKSTVPDLCCWSWINVILVTPRLFVGVACGCCCSCCFCRFVDFYFMFHNSPSHLCLEECIYDSRYISFYIYTLAQASLFVIGMYFVLLWMLPFEGDSSIWTFKMAVFHTHSCWFSSSLVDRFTLCPSVTSKQSRCFLLGPHFPFSMFIALFLCIPGYSVLGNEYGFFSASLSLCYWIEEFAKQSIPQMHFMTQAFILDKIR